MFLNLYKLFLLLPIDTKSKIIKINFLIVVQSILEITSMSAFYIAISMMLGSELAREYEVLFVFDDLSHELQLLIITLFLLLSSAVISVYTVNKYSFVSANIGVVLSELIFTKILKSDYRVFSKYTDYNLKKDVAIEAQRASDKVILPFFRLSSKLGLGGSYFFMMLFIAPEFTLFFLVMIVALYGTIYLFSKRQLKANDSIISNSIDSRYSILSDAIYARRDLKLYSVESYFTEKFSDFGRLYAKSTGVNRSLAEYPKYIVELMIIAGVVIIAYVVDLESLSINEISAFTTIMALGMKLLPCVQQIFRALSVMKGNCSSLAHLIDILLHLEKINDRTAQNIELCTEEDCDIELRVTNLSFKKNERDGVSFKAIRGLPIYLTGASGSGKTSTLDAIAGLNDTMSGTIKLINSIDVNRKQVSYAMQKPFCFEGDLLFNIHLGLINTELDYYRLRKSIVIAGLCDIARGGVQFENPSRYCSGGELQRIGIARAWYHRSLILLLDEPASALDRHTERHVMNRIVSYSKDRILIITSHTQYRPDLFKEVIIG